MVKALKDMCLHCVQHSLEHIPNLQHNLPTLYKEILIERLANHDMFYQHYRPFIASNLFCENLRYIKLYKCSQIDNECLISLSRARCQLEVLTIHRCENVSDAGILALTSAQTSLRKLELQALPHLTGQGLSQITSPCLWKADFRGCHALLNNGIATLVQKNPSLQHLVLVDCPKIDEKIFSIVAVSLQASLEEVETSLHTVTDDSLLQLATHCPNLQRLDLNGCTRVGKDALVKLFQGCPHLEKLDLSYCNRLRQHPESEVLWTLPQSLRELSLCGILLEDEGIFVECLQRLRNINSIRLCGVSALNDDTLTKVLEHIGGKLSLLDLSGGITRKLTDRGLAAVARYCTSLESLSISLLHMPTGITLMPLFKDRDRALQLKKLYLSCNMIELELLHKIAATCHHLDQLDLSGLVCVTDDLLSQLAHNCRHISHLSIKGCRQVTDYGVCEVVRCCPLRRLVVSGINNLTDKSLFALANSNPYLEEIYLNGCSKTTPMAIKYLMDCCVPRLYVQHCVPNAVPDQLMAKNLDTGEFCRADLLHTS
ncbi:F-box/LRR-repeat protein 2-like [Haliotis cracherodii]|uniref:F-box/LRR-repeat protein 2-like n=1 Tax=Haliotis cracherodii TaxID=6455 RepID=UPI0039E93547